MRFISVSVSWVALIVLVGGCSTRPRSSDPMAFQRGDSVYKMNMRKISNKGEWPMIENKGQGEVFKPEDGLVGWYGYRNEKTQTASGENYDPEQLTAAHRSLPFGTIVRVLRVDKGINVTVRINDRDPAAQGKVIEVSRKAAEKIDLIQDGTAPCRIEVLEYPAVETEGPGGKS